MDDDEKSLVDELPNDVFQNLTYLHGTGSNPGNRRKKADWVTKMATILSFVSWVVAFVVLIVLDRAQPEKHHLFTRFYNTEVREYWESPLLSVALMLLIAALAICIFAFIFNMLRMKRKTDKYKKSIIIIGGVTVIGIAFFLFSFGSLIF